MPPPFSKALITGATSGIGESLCHLLASKGINLIISGRNEDKLSKLSSTLKNLVTVKTIKADLEIPSELNILIKTIQNELPDLIINNAGFGLYGDILSHSTQSQLDVLNINANVPLEITLEAAKALHSNKKQGVILNVASAAAFYVYPTFSVYSSAKRFLVQLSKSLDGELKPYGIRVLVSCPGMVDTQFVRRASLGKTKESGMMVMDAEEAANHIWNQIERRKPCIIFDWKTRWGTYLAKLLLPDFILTKILKESIRNRY